MILVTGGTGFLGSYLLRALVNAGKPVRALYRERIPAQLQDIQQQVQWFQGDILDVTSLEEAMQGITQVYHCAAIVSFHPSTRQCMMQINVEGTANVVNMALDAGVQKLVHVSSVAALGRAKNNAAIDERAEWQDSRNNSQYAVSKYRGEMEVWRGIAEGLNAAIVNPAIILGSGFWQEGSGTLVKHVWKEFPFYTSGVNGYVDVEDVVRVMMLLMDGPVKGQRFVLAAENRSYFDLFSEMAGQLGKKPPHISVQPWMAEVVWRLEKVKGLFSDAKPVVTKETARTAQLQMYYDSSKLLKTLPGFQFKPLTQTIAEICRSFKEDVAAGKLSKQ
ncbi:NAD-dependent epimerase/dehydratase family protein [Chitinophaga agrisoli]|uniref:NAD-dependent epimerase/dehydratase family protein n=1 Tax=Chitinophaga agrisoli TaxID=2607653 RepID=A0A5B2W3U2_9BACT|nr:NAD-dependent epimerase/dehydratase family protein [Chitinophaga agrisoli]KAA2244949.1 NAD-dependent epimerase/dehydratase family protein [Chitinophaga agrisoli]